jgi:hypothetical protein
MRGERASKKGILARHWWLTPIILPTQEDYSSKPPQANSLRDSCLEKPITNRAG